MTRAEVTRRHDSRAQLRRRHTLAVAVTVAGTYANATLREAVALPRSSCGPFVQLAARGRVTHVISSHRMRLLPDPYGGNGRAAAAWTGQNGLTSKKPSQLHARSLRREGRGYVPHDHGAARAHALPGDRAVGRTERRYCHRREGGIRFEPKSRAAERGVGMGQWGGWTRGALSMHGCPTM